MKLFDLPNERPSSNAIIIEVVPERRSTYFRAREVPQWMEVQAVDNETD
jgi:hypothetical protein